MCVGRGELKVVKALDFRTSELMCIQEMVVKQRHKVGGGGGGGEPRHRSYISSKGVGRGAWLLWNPL